MTPIDSIDFKSNVRYWFSFGVILLGELTWHLYVYAKTPIALVETCLLLILQHA